MNPKYVMVAKRDPTKRYFIVSMKISNDVGSLSQIARVLAVRDLNILEGYTCSTNEKTMAVWSFIAEPLNPRMDKKFLLELLKEEGYVREVQVEESEDGLVIDSLNFPVVWGSGDRAILLGAEFIRKTFEAAVTRFGEKGREVVYDLGLNYGKERFNALFAGAPSLDIRKALNSAAKLVGATGMGRARMVTFDPLQHLVRVEVLECFECQGRKSDHGCSDFVRGIIAGAVSAAFQKDLLSRENRCIGKGDPACMIEVAAFFQN